MSPTNAGFDFFGSGGLPAPAVPVEEVAEILRAGWDLRVILEPLGSQQDQNLLARSDDGAVLGVVKIANPAFSATELAAQDAVAARIAAAAPGLRVAATLADDRGRPRSAEVDTSTGRLAVRLIEHLPGGTLTGDRYLSPAVVARMGEVAGRVSAALADLDHPGLDRVLQWDPRVADRVVGLLAAEVADPALRDRVEREAAAAWARVAAVADDLPVQPVHLDLTDDNLVLASGTGAQLPDGIIDLGDASRSWAVSELAIAISSVLHHAGAEPHHVLPAIAAFHRVRPLAPAEVEALWPIVVLRGAVLVVSGSQQVRIDGGANAYAAEGLERELRIFEQAVSVPTPVMTALIGAAIGVDAPAGTPTRAGAPAPAGARAAAADGSGSRPDPRYAIVPGLDAARASRLDVSVSSSALDGGAWLEPDLEERLAADAIAAGASAAWLPRGEPRISASRPYADRSTPTVPTGIDLWLAEALPLACPGDGTVIRSAAAGASEPGHVVVRLAARPGGGAAGAGAVRLEIEGALVAVPEPGTAVGAGSPLGLLGAGERVRLRLVDADAPEVPHLVRPELAPGWLALTADPAEALGLVPNDLSDRDASRTSTASALLARRAHAFAGVQEHYYADPPRIERGWREHLVGADGRTYLDMVNNVTPLGHGHLGLADAVARQLRTLNTNSRFHYGALVELSERLAGLLPDPLDTVLLVNSGSEAADLAIRIARAATGRPDVLAVAEAYHGWTLGSDAVSTSIADNPGALATRPDWVHVLDAPNPYRGIHRGEDAARYAPDAARRIAGLVAAGRPPAGFIAETFTGNAGGIALPDGYLAEVYAAVRAAGGLAIADEVQAGYGRLGEWFWGFEQQGVVPDIVAVAKAMGNGYPLGAVVTTREIAERFAAEGSFFSSTGGSPASCAAGLAVLDAFRDERLQRNAVEVGAHLKSSLAALAERHPLIGTVHGLGLYLGVEFVRDRRTLEPATAETAAICDRLRELGVIMQPTGDHRNVLKVKPPLCLDAASADHFVAKLDQVLAEGW
ncbi:aminotransferase [Agromyces sp. MMS24-JH15]|uniref:aminotransferase n=1 Tax=Agromyces sp. MMS24-JH15 TaxID=3243765 RepID=UPI00374A3C05